MIHPAGGVVATDGRGRGPASRVRQLAGWGGLAWWGQTDHLRGLAPAEEGASSIRRSVSGTWGPRSRGACGHALCTWGRRVLDKRAVWQRRRARGVESVALDADWQECQVGAREFGEKGTRHAEGVHRRYASFFLLRGLTIIYIAECSRGKHDGLWGRRGSLS